MCLCRDAPNIEEGKPVVRGGLEEEAGLGCEIGSAAVAEAGTEEGVPVHLLAGSSPSFPTSSASPFAGTSLQRLQGIACKESRTDR